MQADPCAPRRAAPLPAQERRAAVLEATVPLLRERGAHVSTRELAEAAGVAEGTLFRVFPDKRALLRAALAQAMDPEPLERDLGALDRGLPLATRVLQVVELLRARMDGIVELLTALHGLAHEVPTGGGPHAGPAAEHEARDRRVLAAVAAVLAGDAAELAVTPMQAAGILRGAVLGDRLPGVPAAARVTPGVLASCLTRGLLAGRASAAPAGEAPC